MSVLPVNASTGSRACVALFALIGLTLSSMPGASAQGWDHYGADAGGQHYSAASQITPGNVSNLEPAWTFHTGELGKGFAGESDLTFETTPILIGRTLYFSTGTGKAFAVDAVSGRKLWSFDAHIDRRVFRPEMTSRGVSYWKSHEEGTAECLERVFLPTVDARLIALDARTGRLCRDFGKEGAIDLSRNVRKQAGDNYEITSPPAIVGDDVVVGSSIGDNRGSSIELGAVRGYDARTGVLRWVWDPIPRAARIPQEASNPLFGETEQQAAQWTGAANAWGVISAAPGRGLVFVPTGSASPDFFGGMRAGDDKWANSVVALEASTGRVVWGQQLVHHDLWDYDAPAEPVVTEVVRNGQRIPAVLQVTKSGQLFAFNRDTGEPIVPVTERPVPQDAVPGELLSATQPFSAIPPLTRTERVTPDDAWGLTFWDRGKCAQKIAALHSEGIFTPPNLQGIIERPGYAGGANWGGMAFDPRRQLAVVTVMDVPTLVQLIPRADFVRIRASNQFPQSEFAEMRGTPYGMRREPLLSSFGVPCTAPPWGMLVAVNLTTGKIAWRVPLGTSRDVAPWPFWYVHGVPALGGPIATTTGLVFVGAAVDNYLRAFDVASGQELWRGRIPGGGQATPMTYEIDHRQFVVIAAGGHGKLNTTRSDALVAYALPSH